MDMKTTKFLVAALCCFVMTACNGNVPDNDNNNSQNQELIDQLGNFVEGIGTIVDTQTLENGTIVMTDEKRNTITQDKDGNITIQTKNGTTYIDNSINENPNAPKDKWYNTTWVHGNNSDSPSIYPMDEVPIFFHHLETLGFQVDQEDVSQEKNRLRSIQLWRIYHSFLYHYRLVAAKTYDGQIYIQSFL